MKHLVNLVGHINDQIFVASIKIGGILLVDMWPCGCFITIVIYGKHAKVQKY